MMLEPKIIYEDKDVAVLLKPPGMPSQPDYSRDLSLLDWYRTRQPGAELVHRLDRPVGGLLVLAKTQAAAGGLGSLLQSGGLNKKYLAVVAGRVEPEEATLTDYLQKVKGNRALVVSSKAAQAKKAVLSYRRIAVIEREGRSLSLLEIALETGRFHQIRAQLGHGGWPIEGDRKYNGSPGMDGRIALFASELSFRHPVSGKLLSFEEQPEMQPFNYFEKRDGYEKG